MTGQVFEIKKKAGMLIQLGIKVDEFIINFLVKGGELKKIGFECEGKWHEPKKAHKREAFRVARGFLLARKKRKEAQEKQLSFNFTG